MGDVVCAYGSGVTLSEMMVRYPLTCQVLAGMGLDNCCGSLNLAYEFIDLRYDVLDACERALSNMTEDERQLMVCGEQTDSQNVMVKYGIGAYVLQSFLFLVFDGPYSGVYDRDGG